jgi:hypothetical protein
MGYGPTTSHPPVPPAYAILSSPASYPDGLPRAEFGGTPPPTRQSKVPPSFHIVNGYRFFW